MFRWLLEKLFPKVRRITIAKSALEDVCEMARSAHPNEMIAFFAASKGNNHGHIHIDELQLQAYTASRDSASVLLSNIPMTSTIIGTVHSHPGVNRTPSDADLHLWSKFGFVHAIIGQPYVETSISFYQKNGKRILVEIV